jgi:hypothetical protein
MCSQKSLATLSPAELEALFDRAAQNVIRFVLTRPPSLLLFGAYSLYVCG